MQDWNTNDMIFDIPALIEFLSGSTTLSPGTVILTGTPHGVGMAPQTAPLADTNDMIFDVPTLIEIPEREHHAVTGASDSYRHAAWRGNGPETARCCGRATASRLRLKRLAH